MQNFEMYINFMEFFGARIMREENQYGVLEDGIFIPFDLNNIKVGRKGAVFARLWANAFIRENAKGETHFIRQKLPMEILNRRTELGVPNSQVLGHMKPMMGLTAGQRERAREYGREDERVKVVK